jgi:repressor LexA
MITPQQSKFLAFLTKHIMEKGCCPSYREIGKALGIKSTSGVSRLVSALVERGMLKREPDKARALEPTEKGWEYAVYKVRGETP